MQTELAYVVWSPASDRPGLALELTPTPTLTLTLTLTDIGMIDSCQLWRSGVDRAVRSAL
jgi:hypothetical protein